MAKSKYPRKKRVSNFMRVYFQYVDIKKYYGNFRLKSQTKGNVEMIGKLKPINTIYDISIKINIKTLLIKCYITCPNNITIKSNYGIVPHIYPDGSLCLYYPKEKEWNFNMKMADKIIPWISMWIFFYEMWEITGVWSGGGIEHNGNKQYEKNNDNND